MRRYHVAVPLAGISVLMVVLVSYALLSFESGTGLEYTGSHLKSGALECILECEFPRVPDKLAVLQMVQGASVTEELAVEVAKNVFNVTGDLKVRADPAFRHKLGNEVFNEIAFAISNGSCGVTFWRTNNTGVIYSVNYGVSSKDFDEVLEAEITDEEARKIGLQLFTKLRERQIISQYAEILEYDEVRPSEIWVTGSERVEKIISLTSGFRLGLNGSFMGRVGMEFRSRKGEIVMSYFSVTYPYVETYRWAETVAPEEAFQELINGTGHFKGIITGKFYIEEIRVFYRIDWLSRRNGYIWPCYVFEGFLVGEDGSTEPFSDWVRAAI